MSPALAVAPRHGLDAAWARTPDRDPAGPAWPTMGAWLLHKFPERVDVAGMLASGRFVYDDGRAVQEGDPYAPHTFLWFHRDLREEVPVPGEIVLVHRDERIIVIDKPPFLATIPRGNHVRQSVVVRLRDELGLPEAAPLHRLDRVTSGLLLVATERRWRGPYQSLFEQRAISKTYRALAGWSDALDFPLTVRNHIAKERGQHQARIVPDAPVNAETLVEVEERLGDRAVYRLTPLTGRTHQLRLHLLSLGIPIVGDPLYPVVEETSIDDFSRPLQLLASELAFTDPVDGAPRRFVSARRLPLLPEGVEESDCSRDG